MKIDNWNVILVIYSYIVSYSYSVHIININSHSCFFFKFQLLNKMASSKNFETLCVLIILCRCLNSLGQRQDNDFRVLQDFHEVNQSKCTSVSQPENHLKNFTDGYCSSLKSGRLSLYEMNSENVFYVYKNAYSGKDGKCSEDLNYFLSNYKAPWALQMLDSSGKLPSGLLRGGLIWPGHYSECISAYSPLDEDGHGGFHGRYCLSSWILKLNAEYPNVPLTIGLCVPDSCSAEDIKIALEDSKIIIDSVSVLEELKSSLILNKIACKAKGKSLDTASIVYLCIVGIFILPTLMGSLLDIFDYWKSNHGTRRHLLNAYEVQANDTLSTQSYVENQPNETFANEPPPIGTFASASTEVTDVQNTVPTVKRILLCFSIFSNGQKILNTKNVEGQLLSIHGIKFLNLAWIIFGHTCVKALPIAGNKLDILKKMDTFNYQTATQAHFAVDSFLLLSGFLLTYIFLKVVEQRGEMNWVVFYLHRLWRLTPSYLTVVFFYMLVYKYIGFGPFWNHDHCDSLRSQWWKYLLYINNFIPIRQMCMGWSWYLANDVQFYFISPLILYPLWKSPIIGFTIIASFLIATWTTTGILSYAYDIIPMFYRVTETKDFDAYEKKMWDSFNLIYDKPYCRIAPYIIGMILGFILHKTAERKNFLPWWLQVLGWPIALFCSLSAVFGPNYVEMSRTAIPFYNALCRSSFSIGLAWLIYACETGHGGFVRKFLSWKLFIPLGRLTYSAYLIHPLFIYFYYHSYQTALHVTEAVMVTNFVSFLIISFGAAFIFSLVFESPFMSLEKIVLERVMRN